MTVGGGFPVPLSTRPIPQPRVPHRWYIRFLLATGIVAAATVLRLLVDPLIHDQIPYFIYVASVVVATWFYGVDAGVFSTGLAAFVGNYFFVPQRYEVIPHGEDWIAMGLFAVVGVGLVWQVGRWKRAERTLFAHAGRLQQQADELRALNEEAARQTVTLRALHTEAERINRVKDEFLATLSHELRTPLNAVVGWAYLLDGRRLNDRQMAEASDSILRNSLAQVRIVEDLLDVSAIISGKLRLQTATVDVGEVVQSAVDAIAPAAAAKDIKIRSVLTPNSRLVGDSDRLRQITWNLVSNAVKFTPKHGQVEVRVEQVESQIRLSVTDTGIGIDAEFLPHLFERFTQADSSFSRRHGGLGLGLAIVRHLAELHGGTVSAESAGRDQGATLTVTLPVQAVAGPSPVRVEDHPSPHTVHPVPTLALQGIRVLVVDDEPDARDLVRAVLTQYGADVRTAESASEGFDTLLGWRPHVLVADIGMPEEDGYSFLRRVRALSAAQGGAVPAAALTAYAQREDRERALAAGFQEHLSKPVPPECLAETVGHLARREVPSDLPS
jgi:signal transduction histidine kinase/ActR/RegA family two-component response regulator